MSDKYLELKCRNELFHFDRHLEELEDAKKPMSCPLCDVKFYHHENSCCWECLNRIRTKYRAEKAHKEFCSRFPNYRIKKTNKLAAKRDTKTVHQGVLKNGFENSIMNVLKQKYKHRNVPDGSPS